MATSTRTTRTRKVSSAAPVPVKQQTKVGLALDTSGSMGHIRTATVVAFDNIVAGIKTESERTGIDTTVTLFTFGTRGMVHKLFEDVPVDQVQSIAGSYLPDGGTPLLDGVHDLISALEKYDTPSTSFLLYVITDGEENQSVRKNPNLLKDRIMKLQHTDRWTFGFHMAPGCSSYALRLGVEPDNVREWESTSVGVTQTAVITNTATSIYYTQKKTKGVSAKVSNLFTTDLSGLSVKTLKMKLDDISDHFKAYDVPAEGRADEFTEKKTKKPYVIGQMFYLLMKKERIQASKQILLQEKGKKAIWGGEQARELLGLPKASSGVDINVVPGNHGNYDVFVQSTSVNRKLPRGTKVLIDVTMTQSLSPTWDHNALASTI